MTSPTPRRSPLPLFALLALGLLAGDALAAAGPAASSSTLRWHTRWADARAEAEKTDRWVFVDLFAEWCGWCRELEKDVFSTPEFAALGRDFVFLRVDVEDGGEGSELQTKHRAGSLPTTLLLDAHGARIGQIPGYAPAPQFIERVRVEVATWERLVAAYRQVLDDGSPEEVEELAAVFHERHDGVRAGELYRRTLAATRRGDPLEARLLYALADAERLAGNYDRAVATLERATTAASAIGDGDLDEQLDLLRFRVAHDRGDCGAAIATLERFLAEHPRSGRRAEAKRALQALTRSPDAACA